MVHSNKCIDSCFVYLDPVPLPFIQASDLEGYERTILRPSCFKFLTDVFICQYIVYIDKRSCYLMAETYRKARVLKYREVLHKQLTQAREEADRIEADSGISDPEGVAKRARARAFEDAIRELDATFFV